MTLFALFSSVLKRIDRFFTDRQALRDLERLSPELLRDMGLRIEGGRIYDAAGKSISCATDVSLISSERDG